MEESLVKGVSDPPPSLVNRGPARKARNQEEDRGSSGRAALAHSKADKANLIMGRVLFGAEFKNKKVSKVPSMGRDRALNGK